METPSPPASRTSLAATTRSSSRECPGSRRRNWWRPSRMRVASESSPLVRSRLAKPENPFVAPASFLPTTTTITTAAAAMPATSPGPLGSASPCSCREPARTRSWPWRRRSPSSTSRSARPAGSGTAWTRTAENYSPPLPTASTLPERLATAAPMRSWSRATRRRPTGGTSPRWCWCRRWPENSRTRRWWRPGDSPTAGDSTRRWPWERTRWPWDREWQPRKRARWRRLPRKRSLVPTRATPSTEAISTGFPRGSSQPTPRGTS
mmetsp:Transcript_2958/g.8102  ORF Transcript_2958/g.8102 Transcript_2958/m.8102 type:complete len:264 (+) Transcript_2958:299-1090(+)